VRELPLPLTERTAAGIAVVARHASEHAFEVGLALSFKPALGYWPPPLLLLFTPCLSF
jgi:hypothetical protein